MENLQREKIKLQSEIKLLKRDIERLLGDLQSTEEQHKKRKYELTTEITLLTKRRDNLVIAVERLTKLQGVNEGKVKSTTEGLVEFGEGEVKRTEQTVSEIAEVGVALFSKGEAKLKEAIEYEKTLSAKDHQLEEKARYMGREGKRLNELRSSILDLRAILDEKARGIEEREKKAQETQNKAILTLSKAETIKKQAEDDREKAKKIPDLLKELEAEKGTIDIIKKGLSREKEMLTIKENDIKKHEKWIEDREQTLRRAFEELRNKNG